MALTDLRAALSEARYETARRLALSLLAEAGDDRAEIILHLHDALVALADFGEARRLLDDETESLSGRFFEATLRLARDLRTLTGESHYRTSAEARQGFTVDEYVDKYRKLTAEALEQSRQSARTEADRQELLRFEQGEPPLPFSRPEILPDLPEPQGRGTLRGQIFLADGTPAAGVTVTLGLEAAVEQPDTADFVIHSMHSYPRVGRLRKRTTETDADGRFAFSAVPSGRHEFLAVTLDPAEWEVATRFVARSIALQPDENRDLGKLEVHEWKSAPPQDFPSPHPGSFAENGVLWTKVREWKLRNPFYYAFPRQPLVLPSEATSHSLRLRIQPDVDEPFQITGDGLCLLTDLNARSDKVLALYQADDFSFATPAPACPLRRVSHSDGHWEIETGTASFRLAGPESRLGSAPLQAVRGPDGVWRGAGRFILPDGVTVAKQTASVLEDGPLVFALKASYEFTNGTRFALTLTAFAGESVLLAREASDGLDGASFDFSLKELSGGRGYLHWNSETGSHHWSTLRAEDKIIGQLPESVPWWIPPQGFGYAMTADGLESRDYIGVFSRRRGEWIDRAFERISQGPIDEHGRENRELEWPHPEMVGSSISMISVQTAADGDAFYRFGFFDGERQWGLLVSDFGKNDGPWKELGRAQHAYSSPRLQEFKDWTFDVPDAQTRPHLVARRHELPALRRKATSGTFAGLWGKIRREPKIPGPRDGLLFAIDNDPLIAWEKRILLTYVADNRSTMTLLGRDWSDMYSPVGGRDITKWAEEYDLIAASGVFTEDEERRIRDFFILMGHMYLEEDFMNWRFNGRNANFEADRTDIVGAVGLVFQGHPDSQRFLDHVLERTKKSLLAYCTPGSGRWYENPACYYLHASKCRINLVFHLAHKGLVDLEEIPRLKDFLRWGILLLTPAHAASYAVMRDGGPEVFETDLKVRKVPPIGDHAGIGKWLSEHYAYMGKLYRSSDPAFGEELLAAYFCSNADGVRLLGNAPWEEGTAESEPASEMTACVAGNLPLLFCSLTVDDLPQSPSLDLPSRRLEGFGAVFRNKLNTPSESYLLVKQGPGGYRYHRTEGSFLLFADGKPLVFDGGEAGETWRHSTLSFHDVHMPMSPGRVERHFDAEGFQFLQGAHPVILEPGEPVYLNDSCRHELVEECYRRFRLEPPAVARAFAWIDDTYLILHDDLTGSRATLSHWHLQVVGAQPRKVGSHDYVFPGRFGVDLRVVLPDQSFEAESCETLPIMHYSGSPETWFAMEHLQLSSHRTAHYLAVLKPCTARGNDDLTVASLKRGGDLVGAEVRHSGHRDLLWFCRPGLVWEEDQIRFEGTYGALLRRPGNDRLIVLGAGNLRWRDIQISSNGPSLLLKEDAGRMTVLAIGEGEVDLRISDTRHHFDVSASVPLTTVLEKPAGFHRL